MKRGFILIIIIVVLLLIKIINPIEIVERPINEQTNSKTTGNIVIEPEVTGEITGEITDQQLELNITVLAIGNRYPFLGPINTSIYVCEGDYLTYYFNATDEDRDNMTLSISPEDPFFISYPQNFYNTHTVNSSIISGKLNKNDLEGPNTGNKTYEETITVNDNSGPTCCTNSTMTNITIIEINNPPVIENIGVQTIWSQGDDSTLYLEVDHYDEEESFNYQNVSFNSYIINASNGNLINLFTITLNGTINYTADSTKIGIYNVTVCVNDTGLTNTHPNITDFCNQDGSSRFDCNNFTLTITNQNRAPNITDYYPLNLNSVIIASTGFYTNITKHDPDGTIPDTYWYVNGVFAEYDSGSSIDEFTHTFGCDNTGEHNISVDITDGLLNDSMQWNVTANICPAASPEEGGGGGGTPTYSKNFTIDRTEIHVIMEQGNKRIETIKITNNEPTPLLFIILNPDLKEFLSISEEEFTLGPGEEKTLIIEINAKDDTPPELYIGRIPINGGGTKKNVLVSIEVETKQPAFDVRVEIPEEYLPIIPGKDLTANITIYSTGLEGTFNVVMEYIIRDEKGTEILIEAEEITIDKEINFFKIFKIPKSLPKGRYVLYVRVIYEGDIGSSSVWFSAEEEREGIPWLYIIIALIILILITIILIIIVKRRKEKKEQEKIPYGFKPINS